MAQIPKHKPTDRDHAIMDRVSAAMADLPACAATPFLAGMMCSAATQAEYSFEGLLHLIFHAWHSAAGGWKCDGDG